jgi:Subtilase family
MSASSSDGDVGASPPHQRRRGGLLAAASALLLVALAMSAVPASAAGHTVASKPTLVITNVHHPLRTAPARPGSFSKLRPAAVSPIGYIPCDVANAYGVGGSSLVGTGSVIAIIDPFAEASIATDLHTFDATFGLPDPQFNVIQPFGTPATAVGTGWDFEITLDVEWAHAMAPGATIDLVSVLSPAFSLPVGQLNGDLTSGVFYATHTLNADVVSMSWGTSETNFTNPSDETTLNGYFPSVNGAGRPIQYVASAGDSGFGAGWPALAPGVLAVGGTSLSPAAFGYAAPPASHTDCSGIVSAPGVSSSNETVWGNDSVQCSASACNGTGGGASANLPKPAYQSIAPGTTRVTPDVSMLADPFTGVTLFIGGSWIDGTIGGTSLSAPMWAGLVARLDQERRAFGRTTLNTTDASSWAYSASAGDFNDITTGSAPPTPGNACIASGACAAHTGYDEVTGRGSPIVSAFLADFGGFETLAGAVAGTPAVTSWSNGRLDLFERGTDGQLIHKAFANGAWSAWESLGGGLIGGPAAVSWGVGRIDVFARGTDNALWHKVFAGSWSGWESLGGGLTSEPAVSSWAVGRLDVFVRGGDNGLWHKAYGGAWSGWEGLGGGLVGGPAAVSWGVGRIDVFVRGGDNTLWHKAFGGSWSAFELLGGQLGSAPSAASIGFNRLSVFALTASGDLQNKAWNGAGWSPFTTAGAGPWQFGTAAVSQPGSGLVDVFVVGPDGTVRHTIE